MYVDPVCPLSVRFGGDSHPECHLVYVPLSYGYPMGMELHELRSPCCILMYHYVFASRRRLASEANQANITDRWFHYAAVWESLQLIHTHRLREHPPKATVQFDARRREKGRNIQSWNLLAIKRKAYRSLWREISLLSGPEYTSRLGLRVTDSVVL